MGNPGNGGTGEPIATMRKSGWQGMKLVVDSPDLTSSSYLAAETMCVPSSRFYKDRQDELSNDSEGKGRKSRTYHFAVLKQIVQDWEDTSLAPFDTFQNQSLALLRGSHNW